MKFIASNDLKIKNKRSALIIAGTSGIGESVIHDLIMQDYDVTFTWWKGNSKAKKLEEKYGTHIKSVQLNLMNEESVMKFCQRIEREKINVTIYCAGVNPAKLCDNLEPKTIKNITWINFISATLIFNIIANNMKLHKESETKFIYISSVAAHKINVGNSIYGATKIAMERYMSNIALEFARFNIRTLCLSPGYIKTRMLEEYCNNKGITLHDIEKNIPTRQLLLPQDIVNTINSFINNQITTTGITLTLGNGERLI
ncbi:SDR family oxidoreductase [Xenorhabdus siamensis]|uniref:SDR family oxidoreductase n=1 Tax=Xenorhabdus siamensis TaxID=3136254 RepID=UPI0030F49CF9